jgi:hypothetical protein
MRVMIALLSLLAAGEVLAGTQRWNFDEQPAGRPPAAFRAARTGQGVEGSWVVTAAADAPSGPNVVRQTSADDTSYRLPVLVADEATADDGTLSVRFKAISGRVDQAAGLVWRYLDENNYYVVRANALEDNVVLYKVEKGKRSALAPKGTPAGTYGVDREVPAREWNTLSVRFDGPLFTVSLDGTQLFQVEDRTFTEAGRVGLWTKADSVTEFDDLMLETEDGEESP